MTLATFLSYALAFTQFAAVYYLVMAVPNFMVAIFRSIRFENKVVRWDSIEYRAICVCIVFLMIVGCPKFF